MRTLDLTASRAGIQILDVLQSLAGHLPMTLLHVGGFLLRHCPQDGIPKPRQQAGDIQGEGGGPP